MMNYIWGGMLIIGIVYAAFTGNMEAVTSAVLDSSKEAVSLSITMLGVVSFWVGFMEVAKETGIMESLTKMLKPILRYLFPRIPENHPAMEAISVNFAANILGMGNAALPSGLRAMEHLSELNKEQCGKNMEMRHIASNEMCTFLIINISSLQLIPVNIIAYRSQYGSVNPAAVIGPGLIATLASTIAAVIFCKIMNKRKAGSL